MPYAITLGLDTEAAALVVAMWESFAARGVSDDALRLGYPPHVTLAVFPDGADLGRLLAAARECAARWRGLPVALGSLGLFPGTPAVFFLAPVVTPSLLARHAELLALLTGEPIDPHYQIGRWVPHITLAGGLTDTAAAVTVLGPLELPLDALLERVDVVRFRPVRVLASIGLSNARPLGADIPVSRECT
jgi:2'-5' RNA ligase